MPLKSSDSLFKAYELNILIHEIKMQNDKLYISAYCLIRLYNSDETFCISGRTLAMYYFLSNALQEHSSEKEARRLQPVIS